MITELLTVYKWKQFNRFQLYCNYWNTAWLLILFLLFNHYSPKIKKHASNFPLFISLFTMNWSRRNRAICQLKSRSASVIVNAGQDKRTGHYWLRSESQSPDSRVTLLSRMRPFTNIRKISFECYDTSALSHRSTWVSSFIHPDYIRINTLLSITLCVMCRRLKFVLMGVLVLPRGMWGKHKRRDTCI